MCSWNVTGPYLKLTEHRYVPEGDLLMGQRQLTAKIAISEVWVPVLACANQLLKKAAAAAFPTKCYFRTVERKKQKKWFWHLRHDVVLEVPCPNNFHCSKGTTVWQHSQQPSPMVLLCSVPHACCLAGGEQCAVKPENTNQDNEVAL